jgi:hypothetical protein
MPNPRWSRPRDSGGSASLIKQWEKMSAELIISKLDAARRQLETAVRLYFHEAEPVSIHTLTAAAYNVLRHITARRGGTPMIIKDQLTQYIRKEYIDQYKMKLNEAENFFKHADKDPDDALKFRPVQTDLLLWDGCQKYRELTSEAVPMLTLFITWYVLNNPELYILPPEAKDLARKLQTSYKGFSRKQFFAEVLPLVSNLRA